MDALANQSLRSNINEYFVDSLRFRVLRHGVSLLLCGCAASILWSMIPPRPKAGAVTDSTAYTPRPDMRKVAEKIATEHLFGQSPNSGGNGGPVATPAANITVDGVFYSADAAVARVILEVDGKSDVYKTGDTLPDGENLAQIGLTAVQITNGGMSRVVELRQEWGNDATGARLAGAGASDSRVQNAFPGAAGVAPQPSFIPGLQPVSLTRGGNPAAKMRALRQQLIKH